MPRPRRYPERERVADRLVAGVVSAVAMALTLAVAWLIELFAIGVSAEAIFSLHLWGWALVAAAALVGVIAGPRRMATYFGYLWGTEERDREWITAALWIGIVAFIAFCWWVTP